MNLSHAQTERLALIMEELAESIHMAAKCLRHGYDSTHRDYNYLRNQQLLEKELGDVQAAISLLIRAEDVSDKEIQRHMEEKLKKVRRYLHYQPRGLFDA